ncbi:MAG: ExbD/TolR family protein [Bryobacteraceae bacterium]
MTFSASNGGDGSGRRRGGMRALSDINVTPFVDVLLVMLIIFMLTAHVMEFGLEIEVPKVRMVRETAKVLPVVGLTKEGKLFLNENPVNINELTGSIRKRFGRSANVYVKADKQTPWDPIAQVLAELGEAKISVSMVTKPEDEFERKRRK